MVRPSVGALAVTVTMVIALILLHPSQGLTEEGCGPQDYDSATQPDFGCPGPGERDLRPDLSPPETIPVHPGQELVAEWEGALVPRDRLLEIGFGLRAVRRLRWVDRLRLHEEYAIRIQYMERVSSAQLTFAQQQRDVYQDQARAAEARAESSRSWWRSPALWFAVGLVTAGALVALTAYGLSAVE